jgi:hypothetical protein
MKPKDVLIKYWETMNTNDFEEASKWLCEDYQCHWPQSSEIIIGRENFTQLNTNYPSKGRWCFTINLIIAEGDQVVTDVTVTDGVVTARAITISSVEGGLIRKQVEYWPETYEAPEWRRQWVIRSEE